MSEIYLLGALYAVSFVLNVLWEFAHAQLYTTCQGMERTALTKLLVWQSLKDAFWIMLVYWAVPTTVSFVTLLLALSFIVELHAIHTKRWEYAPTMPTVMGVGLSPLVELAVTGFLALTLVRLVL